VGNPAEHLGFSGAAVRLQREDGFTQQLSLLWVNCSRAKSDWYRLRAWNLVRFHLRIFTPGTFPWRSRSAISRLERCNRLPEPSRVSL
jgi:hypothetical protein